MYIIEPISRISLRMLTITVQSLCTQHREVRRQRLQYPREAELGIEAAWLSQSHYVTYCVIPLRALGMPMTFQNTAEHSTGQACL